MTHRDPVPHCILMGNPRDGFEVIGPFDCVEDARAYLDEERSTENMWLVEMSLPADVLESSNG